MASETHFKINPELNPETWALEAVWEPAPARIPSYAYLPINGVYQFRYYLAKKEELRTTYPQKNLGYRWKLECLDQPPTFAIRQGLVQPNELSTSWESRYLLSIINHKELLLLESDTSEEKLLIEKKFLLSVAPNYLPNKFNIPIKPCLIKKRILPSLNGSEVAEFRCQAHKTWFRKGGRCQGSIPNEYLPCDIENDQGGSYCQTHGTGDAGCFSYQEICEAYRGPTLVVKNRYGEEELEIPKSYLPCYLNGQGRCDRHDNGKAINKNYCDQYDGPWKILNEIDEKHESSNSE